jgi:hypothetical protein
MAGEPATLTGDGCGFDVPDSAGRVAAAGHRAPA